MFIMQQLYKLTESQRERQFAARPDYREYWEKWQSGELYCNTLDVLQVVGIPFGGYLMDGLGKMKISETGRVMVNMAREMIENGQY